MPLVACAQSKGKIVVGTWGGDYAWLLHKNIEQPILIPAGWEVVQDLAGDPRAAQQDARRARLPRGTTDMQGLSARSICTRWTRRALPEIDYRSSRTPRNLLPSMKYPYGVGHIYSGKVGLTIRSYDDAADELNDVFDPKHGEQARHHRHPVPVHDGGGGAGGGRPP